MNVKKSVLDALNANRGEYLSGERLARKLGVTRQAVGKAVAALKTEGYPVYAVTNRGYMLPAECDVLSARQIAESTGARVLLFDSVSSTNVVAAKEFLNGGECIVVSRTQTAGRCKDGARFPSPLDRGIYISIATRLSLPVAELLTLRRTCGKIVAEIIEKASGKAAVCEREDEVYIGGNKVCGLLIECAVVAATGRTESAVIGIGIYTYSDGDGPVCVFPDDTRNDLIAELYLRITQAIHSIT